MEALMDERAVVEVYETPMLVEIVELPETNSAETFSNQPDTGPDARME
ncbi:hypothetical protein ACL03H_17650 [Saccharopolyspora sp. MS10]